MKQFSFIIFCFIVFCSSAQNEGLDEINYYSLNQLKENCRDSIWIYDILLVDNGLPISPDTVTQRLTTYECISNGIVRKSTEIHSNTPLVTDTVLLNSNQLFNKIIINKTIFQSTEYLDGAIESYSHKVSYFKNHESTAYKTEEFYTDGRRRIIEKVKDVEEYKEFLITVFDKNGNEKSKLKKVQITNHMPD